MGSYGLYRIEPMSAAPQSYFGYFEFTLPTASKEDKEAGHAMDESRDGKHEKDQQRSSSSKIKLPVLTKFESFTSARSGEYDARIMVSVLREQAVWRHYGTVSEIRSTTQKLRKLVLDESLESYAERIKEALIPHPASEEQATAEGKLSSHRSKFMHGIHVSSSSAAVYLILYQSRVSVNNKGGSSQKQISYSPFALITLTPGPKIGDFHESSKQVCSARASDDGSESSRLQQFLAFVESKGVSHVTWGGNLLPGLTSQVVQCSLASPCLLRDEFRRRFTAAVEKACYHVEIPNGLRDRVLERSLASQELAIASDLEYALALRRSSEYAAACQVTRTSIADVERLIEEKFERLCYADQRSNPIRSEECERVGSGLGDVDGSEREWAALLKVRHTEEAERKAEEDYQARYRAFKEGERPKATPQEDEERASNTNGDSSSSSTSSTTAPDPPAILLDRVSEIGRKRRKGSNRTDEDVFAVPDTIGATTSSQVAKRVALDTTDDASVPSTSTKNPYTVTSARTTSNSSRASGRIATLRSISVADSALEQALSSRKTKRR